MGKRHCARLAGSFVLLVFVLGLTRMGAVRVQAQSAASDAQNPLRCLDLRGASAFGCSAVRDDDRSRLWRQRKLAPIEPIASVELRGINDGFQLRPGLDVSPTGYETLPRALPEHQHVFELSLSEQLGTGLRNVETKALLSRYPGTLAQDLDGGQLRYRNVVRLWVSAPLSRGFGVYAEALDERVSRRALGTVVDQDEWRPRYTLNTTFTPDAYTYLTVGMRYDRIQIDNAGLNAFTAPSAARSTQIDETTLVARLRRQLSPRSEISALYEGRFLRDDAWPESGLRRPGHYNLDAFAGPSDTGATGASRIAAGWGNDSWRIRRRELGHFADAQISLFFDGLLGGPDAHTITVGGQLERISYEQDETRTGGFTFVDTLRVDEADLDAPLKSVSPRQLEQQRELWDLYSSDRGDELHGAPEQWSWAGYAEDAIDIGSRLSVTPGLRFEKFLGGFTDGPRVWDTQTLAPRLALRLDLLGDGSTLLFAQGGRHYQRLDPSMYVRASEGRAVSPLSYWDWTGSADSEVLPNVADPRWQPRASGIPAAMGQIDPKIVHPYIDRLLLGLSHYVAGARLSFVGRYELSMFRKQLGLFDANGFGAARGDNYVTASRTTDDVTVPYYNLQTTGQARYVIGNAPGARRTMHLVRGQVAWDGLSWLSFLATAIYTVDRGNFYAPRALSLEWFQPSSAIHSYGNMPGVDRVRVTLSPIVYLPYDLSLQPSYDYRSGTYYSRIVQVSPTRGPRAFVYDERGRGGYQYSARHLIHLGAEMRLPWAAARMRARLQIYNLLNARYITGFRETASSFRSVRALEAPFEAHVRLTYDL